MYDYKEAVASGCNWTTAQMNSQWLLHTKPVQDQARPDPMRREWEFDSIPSQRAMGNCQLLKDIKSLLSKIVAVFDHTSLGDHIFRNIRAAQVGLDISKKEDTILG